MKKKVTDLITIDPSLVIPVYKQIVQSIYRNIENGMLVKNDMLPSVNSIAEQFFLARGSVFTAYNDLRAAGLIDSIPGKGYFVVSTRTQQPKKIFLLFSTFSGYRETLYHSIIEHLPKNCSVDIYFHHHSIEHFESLIREQAGYYNAFIIIPEIHTETLGILGLLDQKQTFLLDTGIREYGKHYPGVYQNFDKDLCSVLKNALIQVDRYKRLYLVSPEPGRNRDIIAGFNKFSKNTKIITGIKAGINTADIKKGDAFIVPEDRELVEIIKSVEANQWQLGKEVGILSYNETTLKSVIAGGITTITSDFSAMGKSIIEMVTSGKREMLENPFTVIDRKSF